MTKEEIINSIYINEANIEFIAKTGTINGTLLSELNRCFDQYAQQIVLDTLPVESHFNKWWTLNEIPKNGFNKTAMLDFAESYKCQSITTRSEVEKPFRELLEGLISLLNQDGVDEEYRNTFVDIALQRINELLKK